MDKKLTRTLRGGFTLVEMVAVVLILSLLIGVSSAAISGARRTAMRTHSRDTARQLAASWAQYLMDQGAFPKKSKFQDSVNSAFKASPYNIGALLNTQYLPDDKTPFADSIVYFSTSESEVERSGSSSSYQYKGTGILDRWKNPIYFNLDFNLVGEVDNPFYGNNVKGSAIACSTGGFKLDEASKYGSKFLIMWQ